MTTTWKISLIVTTAALLRLQAQEITAREITNEGRETFLRTASVLSEKSLSLGVTNSSKAQMSDGAMLHAAHVQTVDIRKSEFQTPRGTELNFRDCYKYNIAAYEVAKLLHLDMVPPSVERVVHGSSAALTWWVDNTAMTDLDRTKRKLVAPDQADWNRQMQVVYLFDELIYNTDRNLGNLVITGDWHIWMIDHTRAFRTLKSCRKLATMRQIDGRLLANLRQMDAQTVRQHLRPYLDRSEIEALLARRDNILRHFNKELADRGEAAVLVNSGRVTE